jgi:hypothetical protein
MKIELIAIRPAANDPRLHNSVRIPSLVGSGRCLLARSALLEKAGRR